MTTPTKKVRARPPAYPTDSGVIDVRAKDVLTAAQQQALGRVAAEAGMLEAVLDRHAVNLIGLHGYMRGLVGVAGLTKGADSLEYLLPYYTDTRADVVKEIRKVLVRIRELAEKRNELLHGSWDNILASMGLSTGRTLPEQMVTAVKRGGKHKSYDVSASDIDAVARDIADARLDLNRLFYRLERDTR